jgi:outer membrane protein assembly factor BamB
MRFAPARQSILLLALFFYCLLPTACANLDRSPGQAAGFSANATALAGNWPMEGYGPGRGRMTSEVIPVPLVLENEYTVIGDAQFASPIAIADGLLFAEGDKQLHALSLQDGTEHWSFDLPGSFLSPAISKDAVFVRAEVGSEGFVFALTPNSGAKRWQYKFAEVGSSYNNIGGHVSSPVMVDDLVLVGASRSFHALDAKTGEEKWRFDAKDPLASSAAVAGDTVYVTDFKQLFALDLHTGQERWHFAHATVTLLFAPIVVGDRVVITSADTIYALDRNSGQLLWQQQSVKGVPLVPAAATDSEVYIKSAKELMAFRWQDGAALWQYAATNFVSLPALTSEYAYVVTRADGGSQLRALQRADGKEVWRMDNNRLSNAAPVATGGRVYVRTVDGHVLAYMSQQ